MHLKWEGAQQVIQRLKKRNSELEEKVKKLETLLWCADRKQTRTVEGIMSFTTGLKNDHQREVKALQTDVKNLADLANARAGHDATVNKGDISGTTIHKTASAIGSSNKRQHPVRSCDSDDTGLPNKKARITQVAAPSHSADDALPSILHNPSGAGVIIPGVPAMPEPGDFLLRNQRQVDPG